MPDEVEVAKMGFGRKAAALFDEALEAAVTSRTRKLKDSNESLRAELEKSKAKNASADKDLATQVQRARTAESRVELLENDNAQLKVTVDALQKQSIEMTKTLNAAKGKA